MEGWETGKRESGGKWGRMGSCLNGISIALIIHSLDQITRIARREIEGWDLS